MMVAVFGGTGKMGNGLAKQLSKANEVIIGSRVSAKAEAAAKGIRGASGSDYATAATRASIVVLAIPYEAMSDVAGIADQLAGKLVISVINPMKMESGVMVPLPRETSAAEELAKLLPRSRVATAFNNVSAIFLEREDFPPIDILIAADSRESYEETAGLVRTISNMRPLYAGPLNQSGTIERITPLELNLAKLNGTGSLGPRFVSRKG